LSIRARGGRLKRQTHAVGDKLLQSVAKRLLGCVRGSDTVSRQAGDEFVVLVSEVARSNEPVIIATRMLEALAEAHFVDPHELHVVTSIGVAVYPEDGLDAATLIKNADTAMYQAKTNGGESYQFFRPVIKISGDTRRLIRARGPCPGHTRDARSSSSRQGRTSSRQPIRIHARPPGQEIEVEIGGVVGLAPIASASAAASYL
jgi:hypothetical protein